MTAACFAILSAVKLVTRAVDDGTDEVTSDAERRAETLGSVFTHSAGVLVVGFFLLMTLPEFSVNIGPLLAGAGTAGVALGYGMDPDRTFEVLLVVGRKLPHTKLTTNKIGRAHV